MATGSSTLSRFGWKPRDEPPAPKKQAPAHRATKKRASRPSRIVPLGPAMAGRLVLPIGIALSIATAWNAKAAEPAAAPQRSEYRIYAGVRHPSAALHGKHAQTGRLVLRGVDEVTESAEKTYALGAGGVALRAIVFAAVEPPILSYTS